MTSGAIEQDFSNITPGEAITLRWAVEDSAGDAVLSFAGWSAKVFITSARSVNGLTELEAGSLLEVTPSIASPPNIDAALTAANWATINAAFTARTHYYELWRNDAGNEVRLAHGKITTKD